MNTQQHNENIKKCHEAAVEKGSGGVEGENWKMICYKSTCPDRCGNICMQCYPEGDIVPEEEKDNKEESKSLLLQAVEEARGGKPSVKVRGYA